MSHRTSCKQFPHSLGGGRKEKRHSLSLSLGSDLQMALTLVISLIFVGRGSSGGVTSR